jgi:hypothetical protein
MGAGLKILGTRESLADEFRPDGLPVGLDQAAIRLLSLAKPE